MLEDLYPVRWADRQAVVALPEHIDVSNAGQIREELLSVINRGAAALIADMTATISCDQAGVDAVVRAHRRAVVSGTELRLVVTARIVSRVLSLNGLDRVVSIYPSLEAAVVARAPAEVLALGPRQGTPGADRKAPPRGGGRTGAPSPGAGLPDANEAAVAPVTVWKLLDTVTTCLFRVGLSLQSAMDQPIEMTRLHIAEAIGHLDDTIREIRGTALATRDNGTS